MRVGGRDVSEWGEGLDEGNIAGHTNTVGGFSGGVAVEGELGSGFDRCVGLGWRHRFIVGVDRDHPGARKRKG